MGLCLDAENLKAALCTAVEEFCESDEQLSLRNWLDKSVIDFSQRKSYFPEIKV